jgi:transposase
MSRLSELVPRDHFYRHLERTLDLSFVREFVEKTYAGGGRPSIDPIVFFKLQLVMFFEGIRSERQLMRHAADRLSVRWFLGYDLDQPLPDHSSLTRIRTRYGIEMFRRFFEQIVEQCQQAGLVWGRELYIDATKVEANAWLDSLTPHFAVEAHLANVFAEQHMTHEEEASNKPDEQAEVEVPMQLPVALSQEDREALRQHNAESYDWLEHLVGQLPTPMALRRPLVVANRTDASRNGVGGRGT